MPQNCMSTLRTRALKSAKHALKSKASLPWGQVLRIKVPFMQRIQSSMFGCNREAVTETKANESMAWSVDLKSHATEETMA